MRRTVMTLMCVACVGVWTASALAGDQDCKGCTKIAKAGEGFCSHCKSGQIFGMKVTSQKLFDTLAGSRSDLEEVSHSRCPGCKKAAEGNGACEHCHVFVASGKVYHNRFAYDLARGETLDRSSKMECRGCIKASSRGGFCKACNVGFVAGRSYKEKSFYDSAVKAYETVKTAIKDAAHCEACATARLTDGKCEHCKMAFKNGEPI